MILIVGLGNSGKKYEKTRHNIGFRVINALQEEIFDKNIIFLKPDTFMNNSGVAVKKILKYSKLKTQDLIVIHDDIDLPIGSIRISKNSSSGGHKGVQSIIDNLETKNFTRIRIGIRPPLLRQGFGGRAQKFVLENFTKAEEKIVEKAIEVIVELIKKSLKSGFEKATIKI